MSATEAVLISTPEELRTWRRRAWALFGFITLTFAVGVGLAVSSHKVDPFDLFTFVFPVVGIVILAQQPRNRIGWILLGAIGGVLALSGVLGSVETYGHLHPGALAAAHVAAGLEAPLWAPTIGIMGIYLLLLFPDGHALSKRWGFVGWLGGVGIGGAWMLLTILPGKLDTTSFPDIQNPLGIEALRPLIPVAFMFIFLVPISIVLSAASLIVRFRRSRGADRLQMKWLTSAAAVVGFAYAMAFVVEPWTGRTWSDAVQSLSVLTFLLIPVAIGFAILKYRLYDIDVVINRSLVYGALAAFITAVYVAIVVGIGSAIGHGASSPNLGLSILATAVVALSFGWVRERVQHVANRLVYGKRATPYEVLSEFSARTAGSFAALDLLPRVARLLADATGADRSEVWLRLGSNLVLEAAWPSPEGDQRVEAVPMPEANVLPALPDVDGAFAVSHQGELLGALAVRKSRGEALTPTDRKVAADLAGQAGLALRNVRLVEDLKASRQRIVAAQDQERRRLERNIHDGAQQDLVTLSLATNLTLAKLDGVHPAASEMLRPAADELKATLVELRELARGIHPAILTEEGLPAALDSLAERSLVPVRVEATVTGRFDPTIEATAYYVVSEALQNVAKYAQARTATVRAERRDGRLVVDVADDGVGGADAGRGSGLRGLRDRVSAVGGELRLDSPAGRGTRLTVELPAG
jgi:signal transduction histidine kinase